MVSSSTSRELLHRERVRMHYDGEAASYERLYSTDARGSGAYIVNARRAEVRKSLDRIARGRVLDVGCGPGPFVDDLTSRGFEYDGVDLSPRMIERCHERYGDRGARFTVAEATRLPFEDGTFDLVLCLGVLEYLRRPQDSVREAARVLRPGGTVIVSSLNARGLYWGAYRLRRSRWLQRVLGPAREVEACPAAQYSRGFVRSTLRASGLVERKVTYYGPVLFFGPLHALFAANARLARWRPANGWLSASAFLVEASRAERALEPSPARWALLEGAPSTRPSFA